MSTADLSLPLAPSDEPLATGHSSYRVTRAGRHAPCYAEPDEIAQEIAVALEYNGISHATLLATPTDLEDLALGFSFTEGIIRSARDLYDLEIAETAKGFIIQATIASACVSELKLRRRSLAGRTGCGLCGIESLDEVRRTLQPLPAPTLAYDATAIAQAAQQLRARQPLHLLTGATHAAGWSSSAGDVLYVREDVGRHNALDKLIGHLLRTSVDTTGGIAIISSRASFEMVQKAAAAGMSVLVAVSAATTYAVNMASELNVMLAGFARDDSFTVYSHPEYLNTEEVSLE
ncbi:formate dehydrogenase accessory sulfurtransferase FdhD [Candidimonas sp. SYP-B2681]|uniref:formate dehydrogenase accessory sulfurtransferase FdhD n=1 Tax=Candidimonas sp. SYP-B2681 TaxID=2497686 RepID=UPI000F868092|nr:formate dehydrogenase accessory sulfurtransferase FdhD [Candidimonas sp. SYP-B2681]RTZ40687.1 formate dehydrogenase accessory sulfurtransferase FdhD [Candidimonas sp. SYP-B2681]